VRQDPFFSHLCIQTASGRPYFLSHPSCSRSAPPTRHSCIPMRRLLLSLLILAGFTSALVAELPFIQDNYKQALAQARQRKQPIFVECWAPW
jgi:hypothetical protein